MDNFNKLSTIPKLAGFSIDLISHNQQGGSTVKIESKIKGNRNLPGFSDDISKSNKIKEDDSDDAISFIEKELREQKF